MSGEMKNNFGKWKYNTKWKNKLYEFRESPNK